MKGNFIFPASFLSMAKEERIYSGFSLRLSEVYSASYPLIPISGISNPAISSSALTRMPKNLCCSLKNVYIIAKTKTIARIPGMHELNIGHSIIAHAVFVGLERAVKEMAKIVHGK